MNKAGSCAPGTLFSIEPLTIHPEPEPPKVTCKPRQVAYLLLKCPQPERER